MGVSVKTVSDYLSQVPENRRESFERLRQTISTHIPDGFEETISYGMIGWVVPHSLYPDGYHCNPKLPLPFVSIASQKNFVALYHMGLYAKKELFDWFVDEFPQHSKRKLDMGKSCIRFKSPEQIPFELVGQLMEKMTVENWVSLYESNIKR